jgi:transcriptional regulator GlxA family with amidase domain
MVSVDSEEGGMAAKPRIVMPVYERFDLLDVCGPAEMFFWSGCELVLVTQKPGAVTAINGFSLNIENDLSQVNPCDALWVPGGDPKMLDRMINGPDRSYLDFITAQAGESNYICSVCEGCLLVAATGLYDGYQVTTHWNFIPYLLEKFPLVQVADGHPRYVLDRNRLTGGGISSGLDESLKLIELLLGTAAAQETQQTTQYYPNPPVQSAIPNVIRSPMP